MKSRYLFVSLLALALPLPLLAAPEKYTLDEAHSYPSFEVNHLGFSTMRGRFDKVSGSVSIDMAAKTGSVQVNIDPASINTGLQKRDDHLRSDSFFDVAKYPSVTFKSSKLKFQGEQLVGADGELTLMGVSKPVSLSISHFKCGMHPMYKREYCGADASTTLKRSDFGMSTYLGAIGDEIKLSIEIEAAKGDSWGALDSNPRNGS